MSLVEYIKSILENDKGIRDMIAFEEDEITGEKYPSIAINYVPEGMKTPYICIRLEDDMLNDSKLLSDANISIDVFVENDWTTTHRLTRQIQEILDNRLMMPYATVSHILGDYNIPVSDVSLSARSTRLLCREARYEFITQEVIKWDTNPLMVYVTVLINR